MTKLELLQEEYQCAQDNNAGEVVLLYLEKLITEELK